MEEEHKSLLEKWFVPGGLVLGASFLVGGVASLASFAAGKITGNFALLAFMGGFAGIGLGGRILYDVVEFIDQYGWSATEKTKSEKPSLANTNTKARGISKALSKARDKTEKGADKDGLLTRSFSRPAKSSDRADKAKGLLKSLRERDASGQKVSVKEYRKKNGGR